MISGLKCHPTLGCSFWGDSGCDRCLCEVTLSWLHFCLRKTSMGETRRGYGCEARSAHCPPLQLNDVVSGLKCHPTLGCSFWGDSGGDGCLCEVPLLWLHFCLRKTSMGETRRVNGCEARSAHCPPLQSNDAVSGLKCRPTLGCSFWGGGGGDGWQNFLESNKAGAQLHTGFH